MKALLIAALAIGATRAAAAQENPYGEIPPHDEPAQAGPSLSDTDAQIVSHLHAVNQLETQVGRLAWNRGSAPVRDFGAELINDHQAADQWLTAFANGHGMRTIPAESTVDPDHRPVIDALDGMHAARGTEFDDDFLSVMVDAQEHEQGYVEDALDRADDPKLVQILRDIDTMLRAHVVGIHTLKTLVP